MRKPNNARAPIKVVLAPKNRHKAMGAIGRIAARNNKIQALANLGTVEARKERKAMNVHHTGKMVPTNVKGMYGKTRPCKVRINAKSRRSLAAMKAIMRLQY